MMLSSSQSKISKSYALFENSEMISLSTPKPQQEQVKEKTHQKKIFTSVLLETFRIIEFDNTQKLVG